MKREFVIKVEMSDDLSEYYLRCYLDGKKIREEVEYSLGDSLLSLYNFQRKIYDIYNVDCRRDEFKVKVDICC